MRFRLKFSTVYEMALEHGLTLRAMNGTYIVGIPIGDAYRNILEGTLRECWALIRGAEYAERRRLEDGAMDEHTRKTIESAIDEVVQTYVDAGHTFAGVLDIGHWLQELGTFVGRDLRQEAIDAYDRAPESDAYLLVLDREADDS